MVDTTAVSPPPKHHNPDHPPYAEMVQVALRALKNNRGSTETSISKYIVAAFPGIPPAHPKLLPYYLAKLVSSGEVSLASPDRYRLPAPRLLGRPYGSFAPPRRPRPSHQTPPTQPIDGELPPKPRLILRLKRNRATLGTDGGTEGDKVIGWCCLKNEGKDGEVLPPELEEEEEEEEEALVQDSLPEPQEEEEEKTLVQDSFPKLGTLQCGPEEEHSVPSDPNEEHPALALGHNDPLALVDTPAEPDKEPANMELSSPALGQNEALALVEMPVEPDEELDLVELQREPYVKSLSPNSVQEKSTSLALSEKKGLSNSRRKPQRKHRRLWYEQ